jgi:hypothetical protein
MNDLRIMKYRIRKSWARMSWEKVENNNTIIQILNTNKKGNKIVDLKKI